MVRKACDFVILSRTAIGVEAALNKVKAWMERTA
jgi:hypothetical protein